MMVNLLCKWFFILKNCFSHCFNCLHWLTRIRCHQKMADIRHREKGFGQHTFSVGKNFEVENFQLLTMIFSNVYTHFCFCNKLLFQIKKIETDKTPLCQGGCTPSPFRKYIPVRGGIRRFRLGYAS